MKIVESTPESLVANAVPKAAIGGALTIAAALLIASAYALITGLPALVIVFGIGLMLLGIVSFTQLPDIVTVTLTRNSNQITVKRKKFKGKEVQSFRLSDLIEANVWEDLDLGYLIRARWRAPPRLALIFATADPPDIHIVPGWRDGDSATHVANTINVWLSADVDSKPSQA